MTRIRIIVILSFTLFGAIFFEWKSSADEKAARRMSEKGTLVYVTQDLSSGNRLSADALKERIVPVGRMPQNAITSASYSEGRILDYDVLAGQVLTEDDLVPRF